MPPTLSGQYDWGFMWLYGALWGMNGNVMRECKVKKELIALIACAIFSGCAHVSQQAVVNGQLPPDWKNASDSVYIRTRGIGVPPKDVSDPIARQALARKAALIDARYEMAAIIEGAEIQGGYTIHDLEAQDSNVKEVESDLIAGAEEANTEWLKDGSCVVTLQIKRSKAKKQLDQILMATTNYSSLDLQVRDPNHDRHKAIVMSIFFPGLGSIYYGNQYNIQNDELAGLGYMLGAAGLVGIGAAFTSSGGTTSQEGATSASQAKANRTMGQVLMALGGVVWLFGIDSAWNLPIFSEPELNGQEQSRNRGTLVVYPAANDNGQLDGMGAYYQLRTSIFGGF